MKAWKTSPRQASNQKNSRKTSSSTTSPSSGPRGLQRLNESSPENHDSSLSFLDDMLGGAIKSSSQPARSGGFSGVGGGQSNDHRRSKPITTAKAKATVPAASSNDIAEILEMVSTSGPGGAGRREEKPRGAEPKSDPARFNASKRSGSYSSFSSRGRNESPSGEQQNCSSRNHHLNNNTSKGSKGATRSSMLDGSGAGGFHTEHSRDVPSSRQSNEITNVHTDDAAYFPQQKPPSSSQRQQEQQRGGVGNLFLDNNNIPKQSSNGGAKDDDVPPIPFFGTIVNTSHDDDTISQITTSIASQSFYDSHTHSDSRTSGSFPWLRNQQQQHMQQHSPNALQHRSPSANKPTLLDGGGGGGETTSYADTLDEIADMLNPSQSNMQPPLMPNINCPRPNAPGDSDAFFRGGGGNKDTDYNRSSANKSDFYRSNSGKFMYGGGPDANDPRYPTPKGGSRRGRVSSSSRRNFMTDFLLHFEPTLSQVRLQFRYWMSLVLPREWRDARKQHDDSKNDEEAGFAIPENGGGEQDYFGALMRTHGSQLQSSSSKKKISRAKRRQKWWHAILKLFVLFCVMTLLMLVLRLAMMHASLSSSPAAAHLGPLNLLNPKKNKKKKVVQQDQDVRGGMAARAGDNEVGGPDKSMMGGRVAGGEVINANVRGGMARHSAEVVQHGDGKSSHLFHPQGQAYSHSQHVGMNLPSAFENLADITDLPVKKGVDIPFYWHIPRTGGGTVNDIFGGCLSLTLASDAGGNGPAAREHMLKVVKFSKHFKYVNVDTSTPEGIERAKMLGLANAEVADMVASTLLAHGATIFTAANRGRLFTIFRHPVERAVSLFHYVQDTQWRRRQTFQKELSELTIEEYFKSGLAENNWMTRFLTNELTKGELNKDDLNMAKEILRRKCLVGLLTEKGESFARFERFFGFPLKDGEEKECHEKKLQWAWPLKHRHEEVEEGTPLWDLIMSYNTFDMELYDYAKQLFQEQTKIFHQEHSKVS